MQASAICWVTACGGTLGDPRATAPPLAAAGSSAPAAGSGAVAPVCAAGNPPVTTRIARLTHHQYDNTIADLTGLVLHAGTDFLPDPHQAGFDRGVDLQVGEVLARAYRDAAETVAEQTIATPAAYARVVGCDPALGDSCANSFIASFGKKVFRRPLASTELARYLALFKQGPALVDTGDTFQRGVRVTLEALLQSPNFLYRVELSDEANQGLIALNGYETAARLSYLLVNTTPDASLLTAADGNQLGTAEAVAIQATRLLAGPSARETVRDFHHQWLDLDVYANKLTKDPQRYPSISPNLAPLLQSEVERFVDAVSFERKRGLASLFTAPFTFANRVTAPVYGLTGTFGDALQQVELDPTQRAGLLTQVGFLATRAFTATSSPIHRGVFIQRRLLCNAIPDPPPNVPSLPAVDGTNIKTTRQQVDQHTSPAACAGCHHTLINPVGFGLENYDAIGQFRATENGLAIDASGELAGTQDTAKFSDGVTLARALANAPEARSCYARNWFRYALGRAETPADQCGLVPLTDKLADDNYTALDVLTDMTRTTAFRFRTAEGL